MISFLFFYYISIVAKFYWIQIIAQYIFVAQKQIPINKLFVAVEWFDFCLLNTKNLFVILTENEMATNVWDLFFFHLTFSLNKCQFNIKTVRLYALFFGCISCFLCSPNCILHTHINCAIWRQRNTQTSFSMTIRFWWACVRLEILFT